MGTCRHRCIARAQVRHNRQSRAAHFRAHGQMVVGTNSGLEMLVHHHHLYTDKFPKNVAQSQDGSNAYNEMETVSIAEGILTAPASHHSIYNYFSSRLDRHPTFILQVTRRIMVRRPQPTVLRKVASKGPLMQQTCTVMEHSQLHV